jgi:hypothetical protein
VPPDVAPAACESARHGGMAVGIVCRIFDACVKSASAAVSAVVGLPHGLFRSLVFGFLVVSKKKASPARGRAQWFYRTGRSGRTGQPASDDRKNFVKRHPPAAVDLLI